jgi:hypothetical protein
MTNLDFGGPSLDECVGPDASGSGKSQAITRQPDGTAAFLAGP